MASLWANIANHHLERTFSFPDWNSALAFVIRVGVVAEKLQHHPDVELSWGKVVVKLRTHDVDGISELDHELAGQIDALAP